MTRTTATIAGFLLRRIAEDEADALRVEEPVAQGGRLGVITLGEQPAALAISRARVLAECEAKRRIVEDATGQHTSSPEGYDILRLLAQPYASHEDFREDWRV